MNPPIETWMHVTGWTLIHFVWQGGLLGVATAAGLRLCRHRSPEARYAIACLGLAAMLAAPAVTAGVLSRPASVSLPARTGSPAVSPAPGVSTEPQTTESLSKRSANGAAGVPFKLDAWLPYVVWTWIAGVALLMARFAVGSWRVHRLRVSSFAEAASPWQAAAGRLADRLRLDVAFRVVESVRVETPSVIGMIRPVIFLPVAVLSNLSPGQIEALLAHELAHVRRRDYAVNLLQTAAETVLFFHPGVWWVSSRIREEREHCCDDVAVEVCGEPAAYAAALAELASWRTREIALSVGASDGALLARIRRLLGVPEDHAPRAASGLAVLALSMMFAAGVALQSTSQIPSTPGAPPSAQTALFKTNQVPGSWSSHKTDHFDIFYPPDLDLHADRVGREAERAYERVSSDLRHNLAFQVPVLLFRTAGDLQQGVETQGGRTQADPTARLEGDRILLAVDQPADQWHGHIVHEVAHVFTFDILPGTSTPRWVTEGLAEYERPAWDPDALVALRSAVRANAVPAMSAWRGDDNSPDARLVSALGHAAFDFIESRWGKPGVRQFLFALRQSARGGGDPFEGAFQIKRDEFDRTFEQSLRERFAAVAGPAWAPRFDFRPSVQLEGEITTLRAPVEEGLACIELLVATGSGTTERWGIECGSESAVEVVQGLKPGDHVTVTGRLGRESARMVVQRVQRQSDGYTWRARSK